MIAASRWMLVLLLFLSARAHAVDPGLYWETVETENFYIHYGKGYEHYVQPVANAAEHSHSILKPLLNWQPQDKTHLVVSDETDSANGYATSIHFNRSVIFISPPNAARGLEDFDDWLQTLITHEYTHILHLDKAHGAADGLRNIFGRHFLSFPNVYQPSWIIEGIATFHETDREKGTGRGQSSLFEMMMRAEVMQGVKPVSQVNLPVRSWPIGSSSYLYGVYFYMFLEEVYGEQQMNELLEEYSDNIIPFMINSNSKQVVDKDITQLWEEFTHWLNQRFESDSEINWVEGERITHTGYFTASVDMSEKGEVYYVESGAFEHAAIRKLEKNRKLVEVHADADIKIHKSSGILLTQREYCDEYNRYVDIYRIDEEQSLQRLTKCGRYRTADWSSDGSGIFAVKQEKHGPELVMLDVNGAHVKTLWKGKITDVITQLDASPAGAKLVASVFRQHSGWNIEEFDINTGAWHFITNDRFVDMYPSYSNDGKEILFSSERNKSYQIYRYDKESEQLAQLTRVKTGAFSPVQKSNDSPLYYTGYTAGGYDIYRLENVHVLSLENIATSYQYEPVKNENVTPGREKDYSAIESMLPRWWFPFISLSDDRAEYGITTSANDALGIHRYYLDLAYDVENEWATGRLSYSYANRFSAGLQRSTDILRDINDEFAVARIDEDVFAVLSFNYPKVESRRNFHLGLFTSSATDGRRAQNILPLPETRDNLLGVAARYDSTNRYIRSISESDGRKLRLVAESSDIFDGDFEGEIYTLDWREFIAIGKQHVIAVRLVQGWGTDNPKLFKLGGEENDYNFFDFIRPVGDSIFGKRDYALRGYDEGLAELRGRRMQLATLEWRFPGSLVERGLMSPPLGLVQWSGSVFAETGAAYDDDGADEYYSSAGFELHADINMFYGLNSRMRLGYAKGLDENLGENRVYFMLGASF